MAKKFKKTKPVLITNDSLVVDMEKPTKFKEIVSSEIPETSIKRSVTWRWVGGVVFVFLIIGLSLMVWSYLTNFERTANVPAMKILQTVKEGFSYDPFSSQGRMTFALLGLDEVENRQAEKFLTDTIMVISIEKNGQIKILSLPRDLWIDSLKVKINALYTLGEEGQAGGGERIIKRTLNEITGLPIDNVVIVKLTTLAHVVDALGGLSINVPRSFTDDQFPRTDADLASTDPSVLYESVSFEAGTNHYDGEMVDKYIRSRHSKDLIEGTDVARMSRQQTIMGALVQAIKNQHLYANPKLLGLLYRIYKDEVVTTAPDELMVGLTKQLSTVKVKIKTIQIPIKLNGQEGLIQENPKNRFGQWVYEPVDPSFKDLKNYIQAQLVSVD